MDLRIERTRRSIINAFIELRSKKELEKITVKELSALALINKATFYSHYQDIYDLSEKLEDKVIADILTCIQTSEELITKPKETAQMLALAFLSQEQLIRSLFSGSRAPFFVVKLDPQIKNKLYYIHPEYQTNTKFNITLSYIINGSFNTFLSYSEQVDTQTLIDLVGNINLNVAQTLS